MDLNSLGLRHSSCSCVCVWCQTLGGQREKKYNENLYHACETTALLVRGCDSPLSEFQVPAWPLLLSSLLPLQLLFPLNCLRVGAEDNCERRGVFLTLRPLGICFFSFLRTERRLYLDINIVLWLSQCLHDVSLSFLLLLPICVFIFKLDFFQIFYT